MAVLVVDDDYITRTFHKMIVAKHGFNVEAVDNGRLAIDIIADGKKYDLILMDMEMQVMDGLTTTKTLREMDVKCMIVGITSRDENHEVQEFLDAGVNVCVAKPLTSEKLREILIKTEANVVGYKYVTKN